MAILPPDTCVRCRWRHIPLVAKLPREHGESEPDHCGSPARVPETTAVCQRPFPSLRPRLRPGVFFSSDPTLAAAGKLATREIAASPTPGSRIAAGPARSPDALRGPSAACLSEDAGFQLSQTRPRSLPTGMPPRQLTDSPSDGAVIMQHPPTAGSPIESPDAPPPWRECLPATHRREPTARMSFPINSQFLLEHQPGGLRP